MSSRSNSASELLAPRLPPTPSGGMSLPDSASLACVLPVGEALPRPVDMVRPALPALALPLELLLPRTAVSPLGSDPWSSPRPPLGSVYWIPPPLTTSGNPSPFMSRKSTWPVLSPSATLPPTVPTLPLRPPVSDSWVDRDSLGTAAAPAKSDARGSTIDAVPSRELLAPVGPIHE